MRFGFLFIVLRVMLSKQSAVLYKVSHDMLKCKFPLANVSLGSSSNHARRRGLGQRRLKNDFIFYLRISRYSLKSVTLFITVKTVTKLNLEDSDNFELKTRKNEPA